MFVTEAVVEITKQKLQTYINHHHLEDSLILRQAIKTLERCRQELRQYYKLFHSITWNRSRKQIRQNLENKLMIVARASLQKITTAGKLLNQYSDLQQPANLGDFNRIVNNLQIAKMLIEIHHLKGVTKTDLPKSKASPSLRNVLPGLEKF